jgi:hypothetical protein
MAPVLWWLVVGTTRHPTHGSGQEMSELLIAGEFLFIFL